MRPGRLQTASFVLTLASAVIFLPPLVLLFLSDARPFGVPLAVLYFFLAWAVLIGLCAWLSRLLPDDPPADQVGPR